MSDELDGIFTARLSAHVLERLPEELDHAERGAIFVAWPRPPRVGSRVHLALAFGDEEPTRHDALVVWSRPPRPGTVGGFRAQLAAPTDAMLGTLRAICETARQRVLLRDVGRRPEARPAPTPRANELLDAPIRERVRRPIDEEFQPTSALLRPRAPVVTEALLPPRPAARPDESFAETSLSQDLELPPVEEFELELRGGASSPEPTGRHAPAPEPSLDDVFADFASAFAAPAPTPPPAPPPADIPPVIVHFSSGRSYRMHYDLFLRCGEVYVTSVEAPPKGTRFEVMLEIPDGDVALVVEAVAERSVRPPEVPRTGWVAKLVDPDGSVTERLATAAFIVRD